jgi:hypothetical protein
VKIPVFLMKMMIYAKKNLRGSLQPLRSGRIAQNKYDENKARSDQKGADPIYALVFLCQRLIFFDGKEPQDHAHEGNTREQVERVSPCGALASVRFAQVVLGV